MNTTWFLTIFAASLVTLVTGQCPNSTWIQRGNKCYFVKREKAVFYENIALCNQLNASLVSIVSKEENDEVARISEDFWLGLKSPSPNKFEWFDGSPFVYSKWGRKLEYPEHNFWAAYLQDGQWYYNEPFAFAYHNQMCAIDLVASTPYKKTPNPADIKVTLVNRQCPNSTWVRRGNKCYFIKREKADLYENIALCNHLNASLVSITSEAENIQVTRLIPPDRESVCSIWLGLGLRSDGFYWFDGSPYKYSTWYVKPEAISTLSGACLRPGEWGVDTALRPTDQLCSLDLNSNAFPKKTPIPFELKETDDKCANKTWKRIGDKCIFFDLSKQMTYLGNQAFCKELNATMVSIHSDAENVQLTRLLPGIRFWIGFKQVSGEIWSYEWEDGSPVDYSSWERGTLSYSESELSPAFDSTFRAAYSLHGKWSHTENFHYSYPCCQRPVETFKTKRRRKKLRKQPHN